MHELTVKDYLDAIQARAITLWGEKSWLEKLALSYAQAVEPDDEDKAYKSRRRNIRRIFETGSCNAETLLRLVHCVGCQLQIVCENVELTVLELKPKQQ